MRKIVSLFVLTFATVILLPAVASAAKPAANSSKPTANVPELVGYDLSYPQCKQSPPTGQYFGIVGVNGGTAATTNTCLAAQLAWANKSKAGSNQPRIQLYVNTANPGEVIDQITTWPTNNTDKTGFTTANPYGTCSGQNDQACSWQYGWNRSVEAALDRFAPAARSAGIDSSAAAYTWWLDVETMNTWQSGSGAALARNTAALEGFAGYYQAQGATVGLYSTAPQWTSIAGSVGAGSNLNGLANWRPSGSSLANAKANCSVAPLTAGGFISLTQYVQKNLDYDHSCI